MKKIISVLSIFASTVAFSQVGIGTQNPDNSSILHLDVSSLPANGKKGFLGPKVALTSTIDQTTIPLPAVGLMVYNLGTAGLTIEGYVFWDGNQWLKFDNSPTVNPTVTSLVCGSATLEPGSYTATVPYLGSMKVPYTGGNAGTYQAGATITVNGLQFQLRPGKLEFGSGELVFNVSGSPTVSSPNATTIPLQGASGNNIVPFLTSALHCNAQVGDNTNAEIKTTATIGPMFLTNDPTAGYHRFVTSPDGKFSVRVVINEGGTFALSDLQIRSNVGMPTIMWNGGIQWIGGAFVNGNNGMTFPAQGVWYGNGGGNLATMGSAITNAWGDPDVYATSPEWRRYTWTNTSSTDPTMYILEFMLGAPSPGIAANTTNCPGGTCTQTKAFLRITQIRGQ